MHLSWFHLPTQILLQLGRKVPYLPRSKLTEATTTKSISKSSIAKQNRCHLTINPKTSSRKRKPKAISLSTKTSKHLAIANETKTLRDICSKLNSNISTTDNRKRQSQEKWTNKRADQHERNRKPPQNKRKQRVQHREWSHIQDGIPACKKLWQRV